MSSNIRRGRVPRAPQGISEGLVDEIYTIDGFFGDWAHLFRRRNLGFPTRWSGPDMMYMGLDANELKASDATHAAGEPLCVLRGDGISVSLSHRAQRMPFAEKNADAHQIRFYHQGAFTLETELGRLDVEPGDFVVIPKGLLYRETPQAADNLILILETASPVVLAEELWDSVGFTSFFVDYSRMELPEPAADANQAPAVETVVRTRFKGTWHELVYDFDPCGDVVGWVGDPVIYRLNVWDIPGLGSSHGFLPPPSGAVLMARDKSFLFNVMSPKPFPNTPAPDGSYGGPAHLNDYEEVWFNHASAAAPHTAGHLWRMPPTLPHPGLKREPEYPQGPVEPIRDRKLNIDTRSPLTWTPEAEQALFADPQVAVYTSFIGTHSGFVPEEALRHVKR